MIPIKIVGTGLYAPGKPIDNIELKKLAEIEFNHEKIAGKIGTELPPGIQSFSFIPFFIPPQYSSE